MFREVALVTFTAGMLGTSAATFYNSSVGAVDAQSPPAVERAKVSSPVPGAKAKPKPGRTTVTLKPR